jgi:hypothetical protein
LFGVRFHVGAYEAVLPSLSAFSFLVLRIEEETPSEIQVRTSIQVELVFEHLVDSVCGGSVVGNLEFGDLLLAGIAGGVWGYVGGSSC